MRQCDTMHITSFRHILHQWSFNTNNRDSIKIIQITPRYDGVMGYTGVKTVVNYCTTFKNHKIPIYVPTNY